MSNTIRELLAGKEPEIIFGKTYEFREELQQLGFMERIHFYQTNRRGLREKYSVAYVPGGIIAGLSFIVNHGSFKTKNTFVEGQRAVIMQDL